MWNKLNTQGCNDEALGVCRRQGTNGHGKHAAPIHVHVCR